MGNKESKDENSSTLKNRAIFRHLANNTSELQKTHLEAAWSGKVDPALFQVVAKHLFPDDKSITFPNFNAFAGAVIRGTYSDKVDILLAMIQNVNGKTMREQLDQFVSLILKNTSLLESKRKFSNIEAWRKGSTCESEVYTKYSDYIIRSAGGNKSEFTEQDLRAILSELDRFLVFVLGSLLGEDTAASSFFPRWQRLKTDGGKPLKHSSVLTLEDVLFLNVALPIDWQLEWRLLFSTKIHGESFSRLTGQIINQGPTLLIIKDKSGYTFGGFAPASWHMNPNFIGDPTSFLFTLSPTMNIYSTTNFNDNFQYLNQGQQTLPNGLGMGGRLEYFGIWLDAEFGIGISNDSCTTFRNYQRVSKNKEFQCAEVEVWGVGPPPPTAAELGERSVLDGNSEAKALLELAGRKTYSDGLRDEPED